MSAVEESTTGDSLASMAARRLETQRQGCQVSGANSRSWAGPFGGGSALWVERCWRAAGGVKGCGVGAGAAALFWRDDMKNMCIDLCEHLCVVVVRVPYVGG